MIYKSGKYILIYSVAMKHLHKSPLCIFFCIFVGNNRAIVFYYSQIFPDYYTKRRIMQKRLISNTLSYSTSVSPYTNFHKIYFSHYYGVLTPPNQWWKNLQSSRGLKCLVPFPALISNFEIKFVLNNGTKKFSTEGEFIYKCHLHSWIFAPLVVE